MKNLVSLVNEYNKFVDKSGVDNIEEFCRYYLFQNVNIKTSENKLGGITPPSKSAILLKIIGRLHQLNMHFSTMALENAEIKKMEEFSIMVSVANMNFPKKSEVIYYNLFEMSSGVDIINRLIKRDLIMEVNNLSDKRSKNLKITAKGYKAIDEATVILLKNADVLTHFLSEEEIEYAIGIFNKNEDKIFKLWLNERKSGYDNMIDLIES